MGIDSQAIALYALYPLICFGIDFKAPYLGPLSMGLIHVFLSLLYSVFAKSHLTLLQVALAHGFSGAMAVANDETFALVASITTIHSLMLVTSELK